MRWEGEASRNIRIAVGKLLAAYESGFRSVWAISAGTEVIGAFVSRGEISEPTDEAPEAANGAFSGLAQHSLEPGELLFDRFEVRTLGRESWRGADRSPTSVMSLRPSQTAKMFDARFSTQRDRISPRGFTAKSPFSRRCERQRIAVKAATPKQAATARQLILSSTAAISQAHKSIEERRPIHTVPSHRDRSSIRIREEGEIRKRSKRSETALRRGQRQSGNPEHTSAALVKEPRCLEARSYGASQLQSSTEFDHHCPCN